MLKVITSKPLYLIIRVILGGLFVYAGATKVGDPQAFAMAIDEYGLVTWRMANLIARVLPPVEIVAGLGLIFDIKGSLGIIVAQLLGFMAVLAYGIYMGLDVDCGCFGPSDSPDGDGSGLWGTLIRDMLMFGACLFMYWQRRVAGFVPRSPFHLISSKNTE